MQRSQPADLIGQPHLRSAKLNFDVASPVLQRSNLIGLGWWHLVQPGPSPWPIPRRPNRAVALIAWSGRRPFSAERILGVIAPQTAIVPHPGRFIIDDDRRPQLLGARSH